MTYLNDLVLQGKVTYLGVSDTPAWIVSKANQFARDHGLRQFVIVSTHLLRSFRTPGHVLTSARSTKADTRL